MVHQSRESTDKIEDASESDLNSALKAAGEAAYRWNIDTDEIIWSANSAEVLGCSLHTVTSGKLFANLLDSENVTTRYETVMNSKARDDGRGVPFQIEYLFCNEGRQNKKSIWLEDVGRWQAGLNGLPKVVYGTVRRVDERHIRDQHLNFLGNCDPLTGMMNRGRMTEALGEAITVAKKTNGECAFVIAAVNNLPTVNEAYGFDVADEVIVAVGRRLRQVMRVGDGIARYSGGKFGVILNDCGEHELQIALERYMSVVRDSVIETEHGPVWAMLSIGAICLPDHAPDANSATSHAEEALNEAYKLPSEGYVVYKPSERRSAERVLNARCATEIVKCLKQDRFKLAFQPLVNARTGQTDMHEALLRMAEGSNGELIAASHLIPVAEHLGLVRLVDRAVMQMIVHTLHTYPQANLSMNVSGVTATDPHWYEQLLEVIKANSEITNRLTVEITETVALNDLAATRYFVESLRSAGCGVAIDDFGTGYTSFRNLRELPINMLKLDGSFCGNLRKNKDNEYMVRSLLDLSQKFNFKTVAEWVEQEEDADALKEWGVDYLQGNLLGEATIVPPWTAVSSNTFNIAEVLSPVFTPTPPKEVAPPEHVQQEAPSPEEALASVHINTVANANEDLLDLDFSDIDLSIASLRQTLKDLDEANTADEERDAA